MGVGMDEEKEIKKNEEEIFDLYWRIAELVSQIRAVEKEKMARRNNKRGCKEYCAKGQKDGICPLEQECPYHELDKIRPTDKRANRTGYEIWCDKELSKSSESTALLAHLMNLRV